MVENIRANDRVGAVFTTTRPLSVKRDRKRRDQRDPQPDKEKSEADTEQGTETTSESPPRRAEKASSTGQRIDVLI